MTNRLAVNGGAPVVSKDLIRPWPYITDEDRQAVMAALDEATPWRAPQPQVEELAKDWMAYTGRKFCLTTNSGTSSLHLSVVASGVEVGDEVIVPAFTYYGSISGVIHSNAIPIFVDIDRRTGNIDPTKIEERISDRTRAIIAVDLHGLPADFDEINAIAERHGLKVIEDGAQAHGARYKGRPVGALSDFSGCSLNGSKNLSALCEGGLFATDEEDAYNLARRVMMFGEGAKVGQPADRSSYLMGFNYRMDNLQAAFARSQLRRLDAMIAQKIRNCDRLTEQLRDIEGIETPYAPSDRTHGYFFYPVSVKPEQLGLNIPAGQFRVALEKALQAEGVNARRWQTAPLTEHTTFYHRNAYGKGCPWQCPFGRGNVEFRPEDYPEARRYAEETFVIGHSTDGLGPPNDFELMDAYAAGFHKVLVEHRDELIALALGGRV